MSSLQAVIESVPALFFLKELLKDKGRDFANVETAPVLSQNTHTHVQTHTCAQSLHCHPWPSHPDWLIRRSTERVWRAAWTTEHQCVGRQSINQPVCSDNWVIQDMSCTVSVLWGQRSDTSLADEALHLSVCACVCQRDKTRLYQLLITYSNPRFTTPAELTQAITEQVPL